MIITNWGWGIATIAALSATKGHNLRSHADEPAIPAVNYMTVGLDPSPTATDGIVPGGASTDLRSAHAALAYWI